jgi:uncharacterized membrane protein
MELITASVAAGLVLGVLDAIWLGFVVRDWLVKQFGGRLLQPVFWPPAIAFYVIYSAGLGVLAVAPAMAAGGDIVMALGLGGFLGLIAYGTYDLTNLATMRDWPRAFVAVDLVFGVTASALSAAGAVLLLTLTGLG